MAHELHKIGYQGLRLCTQYHDGISYRIHIAPSVLLTHDARSNVIIAVSDGDYPTPKEVSKMVPTDPKRSYAEALFELHPTFIPTQALYLDLEGSGGGSEEILSVYWPFLPSDKRFSWLKRTATTEIDLLSINELVSGIGADRVKSVVVFSGGQPSPDERDRVIDLLGKDPFPDSEWINLHYVLRQCR